MWRAAFLPWPTAVVMVRAPPIMSPPAKMPSAARIERVDFDDIAAADLHIRARFFRNSTSECWPTASTSESVLSVWNCPVPTQPVPSGSISICSTTISSSPNCFTVESHLIFTPSAKASIASYGCASICALSKRKMITASSAPSRLAMRAASIAVLPPPTMPTTRPSDWRAILLDALHQRDGVDDLAAVHGRNVEVVGDLRADREEHRVELAGRLLGEHVGHASVAHDPSRPSLRCARSRLPSPSRGRR